MGIKTIGKRGGEEEIPLECGSGSLEEGSKKRRRCADDDRAFQ